MNRAANSAFRCSKMSVHGDGIPPAEARREKCAPARDVARERETSERTLIRRRSNCTVIMSINIQNSGGSTITEQEAIGKMPCYLFSRTYAARRVRRPRRGIGPNLPHTRARPSAHTRQPRTFLGLHFGLVLRARRAPPALRTHIFAASIQKTR